MSTTTTNYGLIKPGTDDPILVGQLNDNMDTIDTVLKDHSDKIDAASLGIKYKGEVNYYADLPNSAEIGDAYTVKYAGSSGTTPDGTEYVWGTVSGTNQWINFSKDSYTKAEVDALLALKVDTAGTGLSKSGTTLNHSNSTTAKTTQGFAQIAYDAQGHITGSTAATTAQANAINSGIDSTKVAQIETNKNNISYYQPVIKRKVAFQGAAGTYSIVNDCTIELPQDASTRPVYRISGVLGQSQVGIRGIILSKSNNPSDFDTEENVLCKAEQSAGIHESLSCSDIWFNRTDDILYVYCWVKAAATGDVRVYTISERLG